MSEIICGIYKITSPSQKIYIGQSANIYKRWRGHVRPTTKNNSIILKSILHYGPEKHVFEIVHRLPLDVSQEVIDIYEQTYISAYRDAGLMLLNLTAGGRGCGERRMNEKTRLAILKANKGSKRTPDQINKISLSAMGNNKGVANKGKVRSLENRHLISTSLKNKTDNKGEQSSRAKINNQTVLELRSKYVPRIYPSRQLAKEYGLSKTNVLDIVNRRTWKNL